MATHLAPVAKLCLNRPGFAGSSNSGGGACIGKTMNKFAPKVRERAVWMVADHERDYLSRWAAVVSISGKIVCVPRTLPESVKKAELHRRSGDDRVH